MKPETRNVLLKAYAQLQIIIDELYQAHDNAVANDDDEDASILVSRADKLYEEAENLYLVISELEER
jgi:copper oxidase (laccase) domain-containing protein